MKSSTPTRIDDISQYYQPAVSAKRVGKWLFWINAFLSLSMPYIGLLNPSLQAFLQSVFILLVIAHFGVNQISRLYLVPKAENMRRKQMLSDAFGTPLTQEKTSLYYNNEFSPSVIRLGANTLENALFSKEVAGNMLIRNRFITGGYLIFWIFAFALRINDLKLLIWLTQIVFSTEIIVQWLNLEVLRGRNEKVFDQLYHHFLHEIGENSPKAVATILDAVVAYETAKASAGILLSSKTFEKLNPTLTERWQQIQRDLRMSNLPES